VLREAWSQALCFLLKTSSTQVSKKPIADARLTTNGSQELLLGRLRLTIPRKMYLAASSTLFFGVNQEASGKDIFLLSMAAIYDMN
jgi:hypothetical protein